MSNYHTNFEDEYLTQEELLEHYPKLRQFFRKGDIAHLIRLGSLMGQLDINKRTAKTTVRWFKEFLQIRNKNLHRQIVDLDQDFLP